MFQDIVLADGFNILPLLYLNSEVFVSSTFISFIFIFILFYLFIFFFIYDSHREREREAETQAEGEAGSMHQEPDVGFDPGSPGSRPGPKARAKPLRHPGIPKW